MRSRSAAPAPASRPPPGAGRRDRRAARHARHHVRPERARRRAGLCPGAGNRGRPRRALGRADHRGKGGGAGARPAGKYAITLARSSIEPFLQSSTRRDLREKAWLAWIARGDGGGATDNKATIAETVRLRAERARLLGYPTSPATASTTPWRRRRRRCARCSSGYGPGARRAPWPSAMRSRRSPKPRAATSPSPPWDWRYYAEKLRKARFDIDQARDRTLSRARQRDRGRLRYRRSAVRAVLPRKARRRRYGIPTCGFGRSAARTSTRSACSSATISPGPRSAAAPG